MEQEVAKNLPSCVRGREGWRVGIKLLQLQGFSFPDALYVSFEVTFPNPQRQRWASQPFTLYCLYLMFCGCLEDITTGQRHTGLFTMKFNQEKVEEWEKHKPETVSGAVWETPDSVEQFLGLGKQFRLTGEDCAMHPGLPAWRGCEVGRRQRCLHHCMHRTHKVTMSLQKCLSALTGKLTTPLSCQSVAD